MSVFLRLHRQMVGMVLLFLLLNSGLQAQDRPNILLIISDDAGYADFGFQGSRVMLTPNLDRLAEQGMRFTQAYVTAAVCGPSRAGLLTGKYQQRFGFEENNVPGYMSSSCLPDDEMGLPLDQQTLAAMTLAMDRACGRVLGKLDDLGLEDNTLVVFTNDNGGPFDANASVNDPLSGTKANHLEGGIRVPLLIRWPGVLPENSTYDLPVSTLDFLPTFHVAAGGEAETMEGLDGVDLTPYLLGKDPSRPHQALFWKKESRGAVRDGDWKLLRFPDRPAELYNLATDISETRNLGDQHPGRVRDMYQKLFQWELTLERLLWQLQRKYEGAAMKRMDDYRK